MSFSVMCRGIGTQFRGTVIILPSALVMDILNPGSCFAMQFTVVSAAHEKFIGIMTSQNIIEMPLLE